jgi:hypothetical protein
MPAIDEGGLRCCLIWARFLRLPVGKIRTEFPLRAGKIAANRWQEIRFRHRHGAVSLFDLEGWQNDPARI